MQRYVFGMSIKCQAAPVAGRLIVCWQKIKNSAAGQYWWNAATGAWTNTFGSGNFSHHEVFEDCYYRYVIVLDGTTSPIRARMLIYGHTVTGSAVMGWRVHIDTDWVDFDTGTTEIDPVDNNLWLVLGDLTNSDTRADQVIFDIRYFVIGEVDSLDQIAFTNFSDNPLDTFPFDYDIQQLINPFPDDWALWVPRQDPDNRGAYRGVWVAGLGLKTRTCISMARRIGWCIRFALRVMLILIFLSLVSVRILSRH